MLQRVYNKIKPKGKLQKKVAKTMKLRQNLALCDCMKTAGPRYLIMDTVLTLTQTHTALWDSYISSAVHPHTLGVRSLHCTYFASSRKIIFLKYLIIATCLIFAKTSLRKWIKMGFIFRYIRRGGWGKYEIKYLCFPAPQNGNCQISNWRK